MPRAKRLVTGAVLVLGVGVVVMAWRANDPLGRTTDGQSTTWRDTGAPQDAAAAPTYFGELLEARDSLNFRWPDRRAEPVRVWVQASALEGFDDVFPPLVREAFDEWRSAGVPISFSFTFDSARAEIRVTWVDRFDEQMTGRTRWAHDWNQWIVGGNIELALHQPDGTPLDHAAVRAIALHEVGHLIGLDHTAGEANVMSARVRVAELSEADRATARLIYALPPGSMRAR